VIVKYLLVVSADQKVRVAKRPHVYADEIAIPIHLHFPDHWGRVLKDPIEINVPDFTPEVKYEQSEQEAE
jgi:hypothetical protein